MEYKQLVEDIRKQAETCILKTYKIVEKHLNVKGSPESSIREIKLLAKHNLTKVKKLCDFSISNMNGSNYDNSGKVSKIAKQVIVVMVKLEQDLRSIIKRK